jgi:hypothetical protein
MLSYCLDWLKHALRVGPLRAAWVVAYEREERAAQELRA